jgi:hypothetical protein
MRTGVEKQSGMPVEDAQRNTGAAGKQLKMGI